MATDLSTFYITIESTTPIFKSRVDGSNSLIISTTIPKQDIVKSQSHRDPSYQASFNRCTSLGCSDYTQGFNYVPSCGECEKPLFPPFSDRKISCLADTLLARVDYSISGVLDEDRSPDYGGGMPIVDNRIETNTTDYYYSDAYIEYKLYNGQAWTPSSTTGWRNFPGANGEVSFNKFYAMSGFWLGYGPCHGANRLYQCAVSCNSGEVVGCWQVGDLQREEGDNPLDAYGEARFGSVWGFKGLEAAYPQTVRYYQIYDPAQIIAAGVRLTKELIIPLNPTLPFNGYITGTGSGEIADQTAFEYCRPSRTSLDFGDADYLRDTNCLSGGKKRSTDDRCSSCDVNSYKPLRSIDKMLKFADKEAPDYSAFELKDIPADEFRKLKFTVVGDVVGKIFTDGDNCYFPKSILDSNVGRFLLGGGTDATFAKGYKQATYSDLGLAEGFYFDDCMECLEKKTNAIYELKNVGRNESARLSPFYNKSGIDVLGSSIHLKYNIDCRCVRCGDIYITGAPIYKNDTYWSITEPWVPNHKQPLEANNVSLWKANLPQIRKVEAIVDNKLELVPDPDCVPSKNPVPEENPYFPYARDKSPFCWDSNESQYKRIWWFFDKSKKFTDLGFRSLVPMGSYWNWQPSGTTGTSKLWFDHLFNANNLWNCCGNNKENDRAVVPFCISCYEKLRTEADSTNSILTHSTLSVVTGVKLAPENEFTSAELAYKGLPSVYAATDPNYTAGVPRTYLYYSRRASTSYYPCDNTSAGAGSFIGSSRCSCSPLPCMDEVMIAAVPIKYWNSETYTGVTGCNTLSPGTEAFPSVYELQIDGTKTITISPETDKLYPLVGPNKYINGTPLRTFNVGLNWDSYKNSRLQAENSNEPGPAGAYKYQYVTSFLLNNGLNSGYFQNFYVDNFDPLYFWNRPISFLNSGVLMKSNQIQEFNETLFKLGRLHDAYHINCRDKGTEEWGEWGYKPGVLLTKTILCSMKASTGDVTPILHGPVVPNIVGPN